MNTKTLHPPPGETPPPFRIAIRTEGKYVNAYFAAPDNMKDPILMGSILVSIAKNVPGGFDRWKDLMQSAIEQACIETLGEKPTFTIEPGPEHERSGNG